MLQTAYTHQDFAVAKHNHLCVTQDDGVTWLARAKTLQSSIVCEPDLHCKSPRHNSLMYLSHLRL